MIILSNILSFLWVIVKLIIALSIITIIHELGHFLFAKLLNIKVNEFSIGFGPKIASFKKKDTTYSFRWILLGGYNALEGEAEESKDPRAFSNQPAWKKLIVLIMGSIFNVILAMSIFVFMGMSLNFPSTTIKEFYRSPASMESVVEEAGLKIGDKIIKINGQNVKLFSEIESIVLRDKKLDITFERDGKTYDVSVKDPIKTVSLIGIILEEDDKGQNSIKFIEPGKQAMAVGLKAGDKIVSVNGNMVKTNVEAIYELYSCVNIPIELKVLRDEQELTFNISHGETSDYFSIGFVPTILDLPFAKKIIYSVDYAKEMFVRVIEMYKNLFTGKAKVNQLSGIVGVGEVVSKTEDIWDFLNLVAIVSLSVGIMNLLPIPPMDGGKILITLGEVVTRKKMSMNTEAIISMVFFILLIILTIYVTWNDIIRIF